MQYERKIIDGQLFAKMIAGGIANLKMNAQEVNDLNVFPIPDGDTGENMYLTLQGGYESMQTHTGDSLGEISHAVAQGMLLGARGNSGVILSQLFYGLAEGLHGLQEATLEQFTCALKEGVKCAYSAVAHPVEGTILTVAREAVENVEACINKQTTVEEFFVDYLTEMKKSLEKTPDLLAVLKEAGVIDSGGAGLVYITEGFCKALGGKQMLDELAVSQTNASKSIDFSRFTADSVMQFGYCTELLLQLQHAKTDVANFSIDNLITHLQTLGDSVVAFKTGTIVKIHVHAFEPWRVLAHCQQYGEFLTVKIENMTLQHNETTEQKPKRQKPQRARRKYATIAVVSGAGLVRTFKEMGADYVIEGGQTNNPSAEQFMQAFDEVNADNIFVLPNNGNVVLAAKQAASIYDKSNVKVVESKTVGAGYSALSMLDYSADDADEIAAQMEESMQATVTGMVARSVRDASLGGVEVQKDAYMGFTAQTMYTCQPTKVQAALSLAEKLNVKDKDFVIAVYGKDVTQDEKQAFMGQISEAYPRLEIYEIDGEQDVYDFLLIIE